MPSIGFCQHWITNLLINWIHMPQSFHRYWILWHMLSLMIESFAKLRISQTVTAKYWIALSVIAIHWITLADTAGYWIIHTFSAKYWINHKFAAANGMSSAHDGARRIYCCLPGKYSINCHFQNGFNERFRIQLWTKFVPQYTPEQGISNEIFGWGIGRHLAKLHSCEVCNACE